ncbi:hypothetical protein M427DRAFT_321235 [Gonapodya prolifera JEL478]|uniref:Hemerythrin-like domain-containing protein n=1 Tax=Gonapodya prolifera (strain JEL478) TaxID=1344416 RepID=A0A139AGQ3_GONPJ|nr:hypothetical protein M427DRAFT_321235 [Gonapodya prolifera JEL478]|eukprot:KXS15744.1 hypothetical protein M427DRAFT_321235 [Gonapodya prolifera JEL478]
MLRTSIHLSRLASSARLPHGSAKLLASPVRSLSLNARVILSPSHGPNVETGKPREGIGRSIPLESAEIKENSHFVGADEVMEDSRSLPLDELIKRDHNTIRSLNWRYHLAGSVDEKTKVVHSLVRAISLHSTAEELILYPTLDHLSGASLYSGHGEVGAPTMTGQPSSTTSEYGADVASLRAGHAKVKKGLVDLENIMEKVDLGSEKGRKVVDDAVAAVMKGLDEHMRIEEASDLVQLKTSLKAEDLEVLGDIFQTARKFSPTRPHPSAPDTGGVLEIAAALPAALMDRLKDLTRNFADEDEAKKRA